MRELNCSDQPSSRAMCQRLPLMFPVYIFHKMCVHDALTTMVFGILLGLTTKLNHPVAPRLDRDSASWNQPNSRVVRSNSL
jgi:hypothetical protein